MRRVNAGDPRRSAWLAHLLNLVDGDRLPRGELRPCSYLEGQIARSRAFRTLELDGEAYHQLMDRGFRRSGDFFYAMDCPNCRRCVPIRVPAVEFAPSRSQRRVWRRNQDVTMRVQRPVLTAAKYEMYRRYVSYQHGKEDDEGPQALAESLYARVVDTYEAMYFVGERLVGVTILDVCASSVSSVYHYFEPDEAARSLGVHSVLREIEWTAREGIPYYYLGYWIEGAPTMHYKANYRPHELLVDGVWRREGEAGRGE